MVLYVNIIPKINIRLEDIRTQNIDRLTLWHYNYADEADPTSCCIEFNRNWQSTMLLCDFGQEIEAFAV